MLRVDTDPASGVHRTDAQGGTRAQRRRSRLARAVLRCPPQHPLEDVRAMPVQITSLGIGGLIAIIVLIVAILAAFVPLSVAITKLLLVLVAALAVARLL